MGDLKTVSQFGMVHKYGSYFHGTNVVDGTFGLNLNDGGKDMNIPRSLDLISDKLEKPIFTIWTNGLVAAWRPVQGQITFGSEDSEHCHSDFVYFPLDDPWRLWATLHSIELVQDGKIVEKWVIPKGDGKVWIPTIQTETKYEDYMEGIRGPQGIVRQIGKHFDVQWNPKKAWEAGKIDCESENARPDIVLNIGNKKGQTARLTPKPEDYIIKLPKEIFAQKQECAFLFSSWGDSSVWSFQTLFMDRWCTAYNYQDQSIGFGHKKDLNEE